MAAPAGLDQKTYDYILGNFGYLSAFLQIPQVGSIIVQAAKGGWDEARLEGALSKTSWWQQTSQSARDWEALQKLDPATYNQRLYSTVSKVQQLAQKMGVGLYGRDILRFADDVNRYGWDTQQITDAIAGHFSYKTGTTYSGEAATTLSTLKAAASDYLVPLSDATLTQWTKNIIDGSVDATSFDAYLKEQAKSLFPGLSSAIDSGVTVKQYVEPYRQIASQLLEINPESVDFTQPKWQTALTQIDPKSGQRTAMSLSDWQRTLMTDPAYGYANTDNARQVASHIGASLMNEFGFTGGGSSLSGDLGSLSTNYSLSSSGG